MKRRNDSLERRSDAAFIAASRCTHLTFRRIRKLAVNAFKQNLIETANRPTGGAIVANGTVAVELAMVDGGSFGASAGKFLVESIFDTIKDSLEAGENIKVSGFGNFQVKDKSARRGRNPQTGEEIEIAARRVLTFKASPVLKKALNE